MLKVTKLTKIFKQGDARIPAVQDISLEVKDGQFVSIIGRSGSGKSTLLCLLGALDKPTSGSIEIGGQNIAKLREGKLNRYRCRQIGFVFQNYNLVPNLTALENVMLPMEFAGLPARARRQRAGQLLDQVGLHDDKQRRRPARLSGGEQQRVAIARALANRPKVILADEPTGNLDTETGRQIFGLLHGLSRSENTTIIAATHDLSIAGQTDKAFKLSDGKLVAPAKAA
jgi:putative ABC transport system ATP-binding protein